MTREDRQLLIQDLCGRLPYRVKLKVREWKTPIELTTIKHNVLSDDYIINENYKLDDIKSYLRPMSSITEEEKLELSTSLIYANMIDNTRVQIDWFNAHHFDYRGLIPKGLAISTEEFNPYKD